MSETLTAPSGAAPVAPANTAPAPNGIEQASAALRNAASWDALGVNMSGLATMDVTDGADEGETDSGVTTERAPNTEAKPEGEQPTADGEFVQGDDGRWHRPDGTFASADELAQIEAQIAAKPDGESDAKSENAENTVTLKRRDGTTREVVIDDAELADEIRANYNDGMRRKEFAEKSTALDAKLAHLNRLDAQITQSPELFVAASLTQEQKIRLATTLLAEHFDELVPIIQGYDQNPQQRITKTAENARQIREQETTFQQFTVAQQQAAAVRGAVEKLIPETAEGELVDAFMQDAGADITRALQRGESVTPDVVPTILAHRMKLYGFQAPTGQSAPAKPRITAVLSPSTAAAPSSSPVAQPANDAAKALADAKNTQRRIRLTQQRRANAAAVPPAGAGAAPVRLPPVPTGATIEQASANLRKLGNRWAS